MRISQEMINFFKNEVSCIDSNAKVYLFGSRTDDNKKGGDIDILILSDNKIDFDKIMKLRIKFYEKFGEQKLDIVNFTFDEKDPFKDLIMDEAILL
jgi:predicted nucleotidyltransferase